jgi:hypothetical protein
VLFGDIYDQIYLQGQQFMNATFPGDESLNILPVILSFERLFAIVKLALKYHFAKQPGE